MGFLKCILYSALIGFLSFFLGRFLPKAWFHEEQFPYAAWTWEKGGRIYNDLFRIRKWQSKVPDMSRILPGFMQPKKVTEHFTEELPAMIKETCIAEFIHAALCLCSLPCLRLWPGWGGILFTFLYIVLGNLPFILIQRYNRPRFIKLQHKLAGSAGGKEN